MPTAKIIPLHASPMPGLGLASVAATGKKVVGTRSEVWLCQAYDSNAQGLILYVKPKLPLRSMLVEALAAQVGQCIGVPCPDPYLVTVKPTFVGGTPGKQLLAFGSLQARGRGLATPIRDVEFMLETLERLGLTETACVFDEWIANSVRGPGDVLFDAELGVVFIDHEGAMEPQTAPESAVTNWIAARIVDRLAPGKKPQLLKAIRARAAAAQLAKLGPAPSVVQIAQDGVAIYQSLLKFLADRLTHLDRLLSARVLPEQTYITAPSTDVSDRITDL